ncbi:FUSC family protein [Enterobacillus tribolii]|uniref:Fusaric acid resistance family protein n=1 Tax=Enterobacillus tribolii TaxID=1487935 RepID=A0A370QM46_9GAMM|nr:FUSC family protein [Enterobacillus tribolii]MBW7982228.1 FUSC family protein [Enterobacillus tribolii]RDK89398.1 fusaric acid resistance family protein [Enterobacillus tribolii]
MRLDRKISRPERLIYGHYRVTHAVRMALAFVLTFLIIRLLEVPEGTWPLITLVVVMGPISFWGNVTVRAFQRVMGTVFGAASGLVALYLEVYSLPLMLLWCGAAMFVCGYMALGKRPYMGLLIGITLGVVTGAGPGDLYTALWRSGDVIIGSLLALLFTSIYPQKAFIHWRLKMSENLAEMARIYAAYVSPNIVERPPLNARHQRILNDVVKIRAFVGPSAQEAHLDKAVFEAIQVMTRNVVTTLELLTDAYWASRESHFIMLNASRLRAFQRLTVDTLNQLSALLLEGDVALEERSERGLQEISGELKLLLEQVKARQDVEAPIFGYVWLNLELARQLDELRDLIKMAMGR